MVLPTGGLPGAAAPGDRLRGRDRARHLARGEQARDRRRAVGGDARREGLDGGAPVDATPSARSNSGAGPGVRPGRRRRRRRVGAVRRAGGTRPGRGRGPGATGSRDLGRVEPGGGEARAPAPTPPGPRPGRRRGDRGRRRARPARARGRGRSGCRGGRCPRRWADGRCRRCTRRCGGRGRGAVRGGSSETRRQTGEPPSRQRPVAVVPRATSPPAGGRRSGAPRRARAAVAAPGSRPARRRPPGRGVAIDEQHAPPGGGEHLRGGEAGRAGPEHQRVERLRREGAGPRGAAASGILPEPGQPPGEGDQRPVHRRADGCSMWWTSSPPGVSGSMIAEQVVGRVGPGVLGLDAEAVPAGGAAGAPVGLAVDPDQAGAAAAGEAEGAAGAVVLGAAGDQQAAGGEEGGGHALARAGRHRRGRRRSPCSRSRSGGRVRRGMGGGARRIAPGAAHRPRL